jgi:MYXO-CTERM domain-containing protein
MLRPLPHRGDVVAAGAVALAALVALLQIRRQG